MMKAPLRPTYLLTYLQRLRGGGEQLAQLALVRAAALLGWRHWDRVTGIGSLG